MPEQSLTLPDPVDRTRAAVWTGEAFSLNGRQERVLAYEVSPSGWTNELTELHEETGGSDHFIDVASRRQAVGEIVRCVPRTRSKILEIGCSSGFLLAEIREKLPEHFLIGSDYTDGTLRALASRVPGIPLVQFDLTQCPLPDDFADVVVLLNVLEHIGDDAAAVRHLFRITRPGGAVVIELPAGSSLFDVYDRVLMHHRRYDMPKLIELLQGAGFVVERKSHLGCLVYPAFYLSKRFNQWRYRGAADFDERSIVRGMIAATRKSGGLMHLVMKVEQMLRPLVYLPWGVRCLITCRKPGEASPRPPAGAGQRMPS
jgi:SAM-dependent methyltransferase